MRVSRTMPEYLRLQAGTMGHAGGTGVGNTVEGDKRGDEFKYLGSTV